MMHHVHIVGIAGTFMAGIAVLAQQKGFRVTGSDEKIYPPMSTQLADQQIEVFEGYDATHFDPMPDYIVVGNAIKRGNPELEWILNQNIPFYTGPQWLAQEILQHQWVLAVAGTHGKTTTSSMLAWILEDAGLQPGFLIGGLPKNFNVSARLGTTPFFVVEADEYDSAFCDKRSKFIHYRPRTVILNNLEYDHADIFPDLAAIEQQFHHLIRTIPETGLIIKNETDQNLSHVLEQGCWTPLQTFGVQTGDWQYHLVDEHTFDVIFQSKTAGRVHWSVMGQHNRLNALAAIAAAHHAGVPIGAACDALSRFENVKRRLEVIGKFQDITIYDDFAHHPTAIAETLSALRKNVGQARILAVLDFASYTMRQGVHRVAVAPALAKADHVYLKQPMDTSWDLNDIVAELKQEHAVYRDTHLLLQDLIRHAKPGDHILIMSNRHFDGLHERLKDALAGK